MEQLAAMFDRQRQFAANFFEPILSSTAARQEYVKEMALCIMSELDELLTASGNWKPHRFNVTQPRESGVLEECTDVFKYLVNILIAYGFSAETFIESFEAKSLVVEERFRWEQSIKRYKEEDNVIAVDIDGVLAAYPENWLTFLNCKLRRHYRMEDFNFGGVPLPDIPRERYMELKHEFREAGKESLTVLPLPDASQFTLALHEQGFKIVLLSARPYEKYKRMLVDTIRWLKENLIYYDAVLLDSEKHVRIVQQLPYLSFMVEDHPVIAEEVAALGYKCFLLDRPYNQGQTPEGVSRVSDLLEIIKEVR